MQGLRCSTGLTSGDEAEPCVSAGCEGLGDEVSATEGTAPLAGSYGEVDIPRGEEAAPAHGGGHRRCRIAGARVIAIY